MVKINLGRDLLAQAFHKKTIKDAPAGPKPDKQPEQKTSLLIPMVLFLLFVAFAGLYYHWLNGNIKRETARNTALTTEKKSYEPYLELEQQYRDLKEALEKKEEVLNKLRKQQQLPVYFLQELGNSIPENVWLLKISSNGAKIEIRAESLTEDAIYQFRDNLAIKTQWFKNVDYPGATRVDKLLEFSLTFDLINPL